MVGAGFDSGVITGFFGAVACAVVAGLAAAGLASDEAGFAGWTAIAFWGRNSSSASLIAAASAFDFGVSLLPIETSCADNWVTKAKPQNTPVKTFVVMSMPVLGNLGVGGKLLITKNSKNFNGARNPRFEL